MPLIKVTLKNELWAIIEPDRFGKKYPNNKLETVVRWSDAIETYTTTIFPQSASQAAATGSFRGVFVTHTIEARDGLVKLSLAIHAFATALALGMSSYGFVAVPPPVPPDFSPLMSLGYTFTNEQAADFIANIIDTYFRTGTATPASGGSVVNWS